MTESNQDGGRSYGCSLGCGNPFDFIILDVRSGESLYLCLPDFVRVTADMVAGATEAGNPIVAAALASVGALDGEPAPGPRGRKRGKNAPADVEDPNLIAAFENYVTADELPEAFR